ncbi:hypothetical protein [Actinacidiphila glaucinigra]|uniref:hypothetical protein n=1 Tax=Actinacidiphila glaucinigra TaxID=235986 RepID=UPI0035DCA1B5
MARVRFVGAEPVSVPELGDRVVEPDEVVEVPDARFEGYVCQPANWESVEEPRLVEEPKNEAPARKAAPKTLKGDD